MTCHTDFCCDMAYCGCTAGNRGISLPDAIVSQHCLVALKSLYAANGFIAVTLYLPQILRALKNREEAHSLSIVTFGGWGVGSLITSFYAWFLVHDPLFTLVSVGNTVGSGTIFFLILRGRLGSLHLPNLSRLLRRSYRQGTKRTELCASLSTSLNDSTT